MWATYEAAMRSDFRLFDEYLPSASAAASCDVLGGGCRLRLFRGARDARVSEAMVAAWGRYGGRAGDARQVVTVQGGGHLWPVAAGEAAAKAAWLSEVAAALRGALLPGAAATVTPPPPSA